MRPAARSSRPRQDRPELAGDAVVEREDLGATVGRHHVVERAPGRIRETALGHLLAGPERGRGRERELHEPDAEADEVHDRQQHRARRPPNRAIDPVRDEHRHDERRRRDHRREHAERGRAFRVRRERGRGAERERVLDREHEDRQEHVGDGDPAGAAARRPPRRSRPGGRPGPSAPRRGRTGAAALASGRGRRTSRTRSGSASSIAAASIRTRFAAPMSTRDRTGQERPDECARDRRRGQQREEALGLAGVERRPGDRPGDRHDDRADDIDREPEREEDVLDPGTEGDAPADDQGRAEAEEPDEQASPASPARGPPCTRARR